jgi:hydrogenase maturation protein HypF
MLAKSILYGEEKGELALQFHMAIADALVQLITELNCEDQPVVLSGGCMCNSLLLKLMIPMLAKSGHKVYLNEKVPCTDGGIALGQLFGNIII